MLKRAPQLFLGLLTLAILAACGGGGCGTCTVPAYNAVVATPPPAVPTLPPGVAPTPTPTPLPAVLSCNQGGPSTIPLGAALAPFALLAGSTITNVGNTFVTYAPGATTGAFNDDLIGVSPGSAVTGFYPPGTDADGPNAIYSATFNTNAAVPLAAQNQLTTVYGVVGGKPANYIVPAPGELSTFMVPGHPAGTLPPGVYSSIPASSLSVASGNLTLDGGGNPQAVWIFQAGSTLTTTLNGGASGNIILTNGASPCNIYWWTGTAATLGGATFYGNVLSGSSITLNATTFGGRALARVGAVTISNAILVDNPGGV
jgi:hypothetical protein